MRLVTVATDDQGYFPFLVKSCKRHGVHLDVLGWKQTWRGYNWRVKLMLDYLAPMDPNELVCFIDAYDVIVCASPEDMERAYRGLCKKHGADIVVGFEAPKYYHDALIAEAMFGTCKKKRINAGTYMGRVKDLTEMLHAMQAEAKEDAADDQVILTQVCNKSPARFHIDTEHELFLTVQSMITGIDDLVCKMDVDESLRLIYEGRRPCIVHANGDTNMDSLLEKLHYKVTPEFKCYIRKFHKRDLLRKSQYYLKLIASRMAYFIAIVIVLAAVYLLWKNLYKRMV